MKKSLIGVLFTLLFSLFSFTCVNAGYEYYHDSVPTNPKKTYYSEFSDVEVTGMRSVCGEYEIYIEKIPDQNHSYSFLRFAQIAVEPGGESKHISGFLYMDGSFRIKNDAEKTTNVVTIEEEALYTFKWCADFYTGKITVDVLKDGENIATYETDITYNKVPITEYDKVYLTGVRVGIERGTVATIGNIKAYSMSAEVSEKNFDDGAEVKNDFSPEIVFDAEIDPESVSGITLTDENGNEVPVEAEINPDNASGVKLIPVRGLEYSTTYELEIPGTVKSTDGFYAKPAVYSFETEENPAKRELYVEGGAVHFYENNPSPYDITRYILINTLDENGVITKSEKKTVTALACDETTAEFPAEGTVTAEFYDEFKGFDYSGYDVINLTNGVIDREFSESHYLYKITMNVGEEMPDIAIDGMTKEVKDDVIILSDGSSSYRFVISNKNAAPLCSEPAFEGDTKVKINTEAEGKTKVLVLPPKSLGADVAYTISEFLTSDNIISDVKCFDTQSIEYVFSEDNMSGRYNFYVVYEGSDEIAGPYSAYYASKNDLEQCQAEWTALKNTPGTTAEQVDAFIIKYENILKLDISEYKNLNKKSVSDYLLGSAAQAITDFCDVFKEAVLVVGFNEAADKAYFVSTHSEQAGVSVTEEWINSATGILNILKAESPADIERFVAYSNAIILINKAEPSNILSTVNGNSDVLELTPAQIAKLGKPEYKASLVTALTQKGFTSAEQIRTAIDGAKPADYGSDSKPSRVPTGGGGGGGGGSGNTVVSYVDPGKSQKTENEQENIENNTDDDVNTPSENVVFSDIENVSWAKDAIEYLYNENIISGSGDGTYRPNDNIKREEFIKILVEAMGIKNMQESDIFEDAALGQWYTPYIYAAYSNGIVSGISDTEFGVGVDISRQDIAVMIDRAITAMKLTVSDIREAQSFGDEGQIASYATDSVNNLYKKGIFSGNENNEFSPAEKATRAEVAQVVYNLINRVNDGEEETN